MPLMGSSAKLVFECCEGLSWPFRRNGIAWGDISTPREYRAGFAENVSPLTVGAIYPSSMDASGGERYVTSSHGTYVQFETRHISWEGDEMQSDEKCDGTCNFGTVVSDRGRAEQSDGCTYG